MIQRLQTIFLILGALVLLIFCLSSTIWVNINIETGEKVILNALSLTHYQNGDVLHKISTVYILILALIIIALFIVALLSYKTRSRQLSICKLTSFSLILLIIVILYFWDQSKDVVVLSDSQFHWSFILPALAILLNSLAIRFIKKDIALLKAADRIR